MSDKSKIPLRERKYAQTKVAILNAVVEQLMEKRLKDISIKDVCESIPISEVTFYNYFPKKTDVVIYIVELWQVEISWHLQKWESQKTNLEVIESFFEQTALKTKMNAQVLSEAMGFFAQEQQSIVLKDPGPAEKVLFFPDLDGIDKITLESGCSNKELLIKPYIEKAITMGELPGDTNIEEISIILTSVYAGAMMHYHKSNPFDIAAIYKKALRLLWKGLKK